MVLDKLTNLKAYSKLIKTDEILAAIEKSARGVTGADWTLTATASSF